VDALKRSSDLPSALREYEARRIPRTTQIVTLSRTLGAIGQWSNPLAVWLRNTLMRIIPRHIQDREIDAIVGYRV